MFHDSTDFQTTSRQEPLSSQTSKQGHWLPLDCPTKVPPEPLATLQGSLASGREARSIGPLLPLCLDTLGLHDPPFAACRSGAKLSPPCMVLLQLSVYSACPMQQQWTTGMRLSLFVRLPSEFISIPSLPGHSVFQFSRYAQKIAGTILISS